MCSDQDQAPLIRHPGPQYTAEHAAIGAFCRHQQGVNAGVAGDEDPVGWAPFAQQVIGSAPGGGEVQRTQT